MQAAASAQNEIRSRNRKDVKRLSLRNYTEAGILGAYDWSMKERETHDKMIENYRRYLMKLSTFSHEGSESQSSESEQEINSKSAPAAETVTMERFLVSNYVRLCIAEGIRPKDAYKQLEKRLKAIEELKDPKALL